MTAGSRSSPGGAPRADPRRSGRPALVRAAQLAGVVVIVVAFSIGPLPVPDLDGVWGVVPHVIAYTVLTVVALAVVPLGHSALSKATRIGSIVLAIVVLGAAMEALQRVFGRDAEVADVVANTVGATAAVVLMALAQRLRGGSPAQRFRSPPTG